MLMSRQHSEILFGLESSCGRHSSTASPLVIACFLSSTRCCLMTLPAHIRFGATDFVSQRFEASTLRHVWLCSLFASSLAEQRPFHSFGYPRSASPHSFIRPISTPARRLRGIFFCFETCLGATDAMTISASTSLQSRRAIFSFVSSTETTKQIRALASTPSAQYPTLALQIPLAM